jgi:ABC-type phosphate/phosphonate transport system substrate-binding protein
MIAALPMYDRPENAAAHDALWALIRDGLRARGVAAPDALDRETGIWEAWECPELVLGQVCNLPWRSRLRDRLRLVGASDHGLPGAPPGHYYSVFVVRPGDDPDPASHRERRFAYNEALSHSGWGAPQAWAAERGFRFPASLETGAHRESARAVAEGRADIAAIDAVSWRMFERWEPFAGTLEVIGRTGTSPGQSFVTAAHDPMPHREAVAEAVAALDPASREVLGLRGVHVLPEEDYTGLPPAPRATEGAAAV